MTRRKNLPDTKILCGCGCGEYIALYNRQGKIARFKSGHNSKSQHWNWQGGKIVDQDGYIGVKDRNHPRAHYNGYVYEHILVMEKHLGRPLEPNEIIHHKNGNKQDNRIENLELMQSQAEHIRFHMKKDMSGRRCYYCQSNITRLEIRSNPKHSPSYKWYRIKSVPSSFCCVKCRYKTMLKTSNLS